jgi:peroxiredoxin family protein
MIDWIPIEEWALVGNENFLVSVTRSYGSDVSVFIAHYEDGIIKVNKNTMDGYYITHAAKINSPIVVAEKQEVVDDKYDALLARVVAMEKAIKRKEATYMKIFKKKDRV